MTLSHDGLRRTRLGRLAPRFDVDGLLNISQLESFEAPATGVGRDGRQVEGLRRGGGRMAGRGKWTIRETAVRHRNPLHAETALRLRPPGSGGMGSRSLSRGRAMRTPRPLLAMNNVAD